MSAPTSSNDVAFVRVDHDEFAPDTTYPAVEVRYGARIQRFASGDPVADMQATWLWLRGLGSVEVMYSSTVDDFVMHATWNAIAHGIPAHLVAFTWLGIGGLLGALPLVLIAPAPHAQSWPFLGTSIVLHVAYMVLLMQCYRLGDFSQVYPVARGVSPLVTTLLAALVVGEIPTPGRLAGVVVISAGLASLALLGRRPQGGALALGAALLTGLTIATYTTVDGLGVRLAGTAAGYTGWLILLEGSALPLWTLTWRRRALCAQGRAVAALGVLGGLLSVLGYGLVLWAQTQGPLGPIAALRETSIIVGALIGAVVFHERFGRPRTVAAVVVAAGILVLTLG